MHVIAILVKEKPPLHAVFEIPFLALLQGLDVTAAKLGSLLIQLFQAVLQPFQFTRDVRPDKTGKPRCCQEKCDDPVTQGP